MPRHRESGRKREDDQEDVYLGRWIRTHRRFHSSEGSVQCDVPLPLLMEPRATCRHREDDSTAATVLGAKGGQDRVRLTPVDQAEGQGLGDRIGSQHYQGPSTTNELILNRACRSWKHLERKIRLAHGSLNFPGV